MSHLRFADDTMFFLNANKNNARGLKNILIWFEVASGLRINFPKSKLFKVGELDRFEKLADMLGRDIENFPKPTL